MRMITIENYAINVDQIQYMSPNIQNNRTNIHFYDRTIAVAGSIQQVAKRINEHIDENA